MINKVEQTKFYILQFKVKLEGVKTYVFTAFIKILYIKTHVNKSTCKFNNDKRITIPYH